MQSGEFFVRELVLIVLKHAEEEQCTSIPVYLSSDYITNIYISFINQAILHIYTVLIYFYPRVQSIASFLTFFSLSLEYEIKREVSRRLSLQGEYVRLWYFLSHLLFVTNCLDLFCKDDKEYVLSFDWLCCL